MIQFKEMQTMLLISDELEKLAAACFVLNQDYCDAINYDYEYKHWMDLERIDQINYIAAVVILFSKLELLRPEERKDIDKLAKEQHDAWVKAKVADGWTYGLSVNKEFKTHPDIVAWEELPYKEKLKDILFVNTVLAHFDRISDIGKEKLSLMTNEQKAKLED